MLSLVSYDTRTRKGGIMLNLKQEIENSLGLSVSREEPVLDRFALVRALDEVFSSVVTPGVTTSAEAFAVSREIEREFSRQFSQILTETVDFIHRTTLLNLDEKREQQQEINRRKEPVKYKADGMIYSYYCEHCNEPATEYAGKFGCENCELWPVSVARIGITDCAPCPA